MLYIFFARKFSFILVTVNFVGVTLHFELKRQSVPRRPMRRVGGVSISLTNSP